MTRSERIREAIRITDLLAELGYHVQPTEREQQFGCDLHGTRDGKPSARVYPATNSWYCFACGKSRDAIRTVMDKLDLDFKQAMVWLEKTYNLPTFVRHADTEPLLLTDALTATFTSPQDGNADRVNVQIKALLDAQRFDKVLTCQQTMELWERLDRIADSSPAALESLRDEIIEKVRDAARIP